MEITFLVGNGFDMAAGVDTSYSGFYKWYIEQPSDNPSISQIKDMIRKDIESGSQYWADFEVGLGRFTEEFTLANENSFLDCYEDAQVQLPEYLKSECNGKEYYPDKETIELAKTTLSNFYSGITPVEQTDIEALFKADSGSNSRIHFISYNYTDILDKYVKIIAATPIKVWTYGNTTFKMTVDPRVIHVHGYTNHYPIIGVNDDSQINNKELLSSPVLPQTLIKPTAVSAVGELWHKNAETMISQSRIVCVFGMSLGCTDAKWWRKLVEWLKADNGRRLILFWHKRSWVNSVSTRKKIELNQEVKDRLISYSSNKESARAAIYNRIYVCVNTDIFPIKLTNEITEDAVAASAEKSEVNA